MVYSTYFVTGSARTFDTHEHRLTIVSCQVLLVSLDPKSSRSCLMLAIQFEGKLLYVWSKWCWLFPSSARGEKVSNLAKVFANYDKFTVVDVPDLATSDLSVAFKGAYLIRFHDLYISLYISVVNRCGGTDTRGGIPTLLPRWNRGSWEGDSKLSLSCRYWYWRSFYQFATEGTERIMDSARLAGVKTIIVTGSQVTYNISGPFGPRGLCTIPDDFKSWD